MKGPRPDSRTPIRAASSRKRGVILVQVALLLLAVMGLLAVVVDLGIVRVTQSFMQTSADFAAVEGLRFRDADLGVVSDPIERERLRRTVASRAATLAFDENLDPDAADSGVYRLGAGPLIEVGSSELSSELPEFTGGQLTSGGVPVEAILADAREPAAYIPDLQLNAELNAGFGDLVAGAYMQNPGDPNWHAESSNGLNYLRNDFAPSAAIDAPDANAFLARLRRTARPSGAPPLDIQDGVSSSGTTLPLLFGRLTLNEDPTDFDPRRDGITVRATAIADARPVLAAGPSWP